MVCRWGTDVQSGIMDMTILLVKFIAVKLSHGTVPIKLLGLLSQVCMISGNWMSLSLLVVFLHVRPLILIQSFITRTGQSLLWL